MEMVWEVLGKERAKATCSITYTIEAMHENTQENLLSLLNDDLQRIRVI